MPRTAGTWSQVGNDQLAALLRIADTPTAILLMLETRRAYRTGGASFGELVDALRKPNQGVFPMRTFEEAIRDLLDANLIKLEAGIYKVDEINLAQTTQISRRNATRKAKRKLAGNSTPTSTRNSAQQEAENPVQHEEPETPKEVKDFEGREETISTLNTSTVEPVETEREQPLDFFQKLESFFSQMPRNQSGRWRQLAQQPRAAEPMLALLAHGNDLAFAFVALADLTKARDQARVSMLLEIKTHLARYGPEHVTKTLNKAVSDSMVPAKAWLHYGAWLVEDDPNNNVQHAKTVVSDPDWWERTLRENGIEALEEL